MKCIETAMSETKLLPRARWWGFVYDDNRFLMRYSHCLAIFDTKTLTVDYAAYETKTDRDGVVTALTHWKKMHQLDTAATVQNIKDDGVVALNYIGTDMGKPVFSWTVASSKYLIM